MKSYRDAQRIPESSQSETRRVCFYSMTHIICQGAQRSTPDKNNETRSFR